MAFVSGASWVGREKEEYQQIWRGCSGERGTWTHPHPKISHPGKTALLGPSSAPGLRPIGVLPVNRRVVSSLRGDRLGMGASPITHLLTSGNTPGPRLPSRELDATPPPFAHPIPSLPAGQTHFWPCGCSAPPQHPPHANRSTHPQGPSTTPRVQPQHIVAAATPSPPAPKILPFPDRPPGWEQGRS